MRLAELKTNLIEHFFSEGSAGISQVDLAPIFESIGKSLGLDLNPQALSVISKQSNQSNDPSKAFKRFTDGRVAILTIIEEDGSDQNTIFMAIRSGTTIRLADLTISPLQEKGGNLLTVKTVLRQAKNRNDEVIFNLNIIDTLRNEKLIS